MPLNEDHTSRKQVPIRQGKGTNRTITKKSGKLPEDSKCGKVISIKGRICDVEYRNQSGDIKNIECLVAGSLISPYEKSNFVVVGDNVHFIVDEKKTSEFGKKTGSILKVEHRLSLLSRSAVGKKGFEHVLASNADQLLIINSAADPFYNKKFIDRLLISAELGDLEPIICINKIDLMDPEFVENDLEIYKELGIPLFLTSMTEGTDLDSLREQLKNKETILAGPSGVGKSTIVNKLLNENIQKVLEISEKWGKGKHATSSVSRFNLPFGGYIIDTPGIREWAIVGIEVEEIPLYFHDFEPFYLDCRFTPCTHIHEPECSVKYAVEDGKIDPERYESYVNIYNSMKF